MAKFKRTPTGVTLENLLREADTLSKELHRHCPIELPGLGPAHSRCLELLSLQGPSRLPEIATQMQCTRQRAQQIVEGLITQSAVSRVENPRHRRSALIQITDHGRGLLQNLITEKTRLCEQAAPEFDLLAAQAALQTLRQLRLHLTALETD